MLVRVRAAGVNPIDWKLRAGHLQEFMPLELPSIPGFDLAGTVVAVGPGVTGLAEGDDGQRLLVRGGAGGVGSLAVQLGRWKGAQVAATASAGNLELFGRWAPPRRSTTRRRPWKGAFDVVYDTVGGEGAGELWPALRPNGILIVIAGMPDQDAARARGVRTSAVHGPAETSGILAELASLVESGDLEPVVGHVFPLDEAAAAHELSETGHGRGRIVLAVG